MSNFWSLSDSNGIRTHDHLVRKRKLNHLWVRIPLLSLKLQIWSLLRARSSLTFRQTIECGVTLKLVRDMLITYSYFLLLCSLYASVWLCFRYHKFKTFLVLDLMISVLLNSFLYATNSKTKFFRVTEIHLLFCRRKQALWLIIADWKSFLFRYNLLSYILHWSKLNTCFL